jgi:hypothetical protein
MLQHALHIRRKGHEWYGENQSQKRKNDAARSFSAACEYRLGACAFATKKPFEHGKYGEMYKKRDSDGAHKDRGGHQPLPRAAPILLDLRETCKEIQAFLFAGDK